MPLPHKPFFSIIIANYNFGAFLEKAIVSVLTQTCQDYELIIVDGGSSDNSVDIIKKYSNRIAWWCSEKDHGQSDAFNKGFRHAQGEFLTWLNADDLLLPGTLQAVMKRLKQCKWADWATGNFLRFDSVTAKILAAPWGPHIVPRWMQRNGFPVVAFGPTVFWKRDVYHLIGEIDESLHYTMDVEYWIRLTLGGHKHVRVNHCCWGFRMHEKSKTAEFDNHTREHTVKEDMQGEHRYIREKTGYVNSCLGHTLSRAGRFLDGSFFIALLRRFFVAGRTLRDLYRVEC